MKVRAQLVPDAVTTTTTPSCHHKEAKFEAKKLSSTMKNARMKS